MEDTEDLFKLQYPKTFLTSQRDKLVILDEIQRAPDLLMTLRGLIDTNRQAGRDAAQFLLLGSASMDLLRQCSESLAGRVSYMEMTGLNVLELGSEKQNIINLWLRGGFPKSYLAKDDEMAMDWLEDLIRTYMERDVPQMGFNQTRRYAAFGPCSLTCKVKQSTRVSWLQIWRSDAPILIIKLIF